MIMQDSKSVVKMNGALETTNFEIKTDDGKMFHILSNLYSNPLGAVVRELSTNCLDGHKIAGSEELPFDIILPGRMDMSNFITFRDYGPGMPHEIITDIFTTFGQSTKNNNNLETGCLGLGSKSPLAITDSFTVTSVNDGYKTTYSVSKDAQRKPILAKFGSVETDEDNGLSVTVPLSSTHQDNVLNEIKNQLRYFKVKPNVYQGDHLIKINWEDNSDYFEITPEIFIRRENYLKNSKIIQGEIGYEFNFQTFLNSFNIIDDSEHVDFLEQDNLKISHGTKKVLTKFFEKYQLEIFMPMGTVTFAPSREELIYDNATCQNIMKQVLNAIKLIGDNYKKVYGLIENKYQYRQLKKQFDFKHQKVLDIDKTLASFLTYVGFGFEHHFSKEWILRNGEKANTDIPRMKSFSAFNKILELKHVYITWDHHFQTKNMIKKVKDGWSADGYTITCDRLYDYIDKTDYKTIKILFVAKEEKFNKKHIANYVVSMNSNKNSSDDMINVAVVKMLKDDITDELKKEFYKLCGLSASNLLEFSEVLKVSEKFIMDGKAAGKAVYSKPRTLRVTELKNINERIENWEQKVVKTSEIKDELIGLYIPTFKNKIQFRPKSDEMSLENKYPTFMSIIECAGNVSDGMYNLIAFLNYCGTTINRDIQIYAGHEKNFKKTNLVHFEDFIDAIVKKTLKVNTTQKIFSSIIMPRNNNVIMNFIKAINFLKGENIENMHKKYKQFQETILKEYKTFNEWFYLDNHPILNFYKKYKNSIHDKKLEKLLDSCRLLYKPEALKSLEKTLNVKFDLTFLKKDFDIIDSKYRLGMFTNLNQYDYCYYSHIGALISEFERTIYDINTVDYLEQNVPDLKSLPKLPITFDEEECDEAINKHDNFDEELLVAE